MSEGGLYDNVTKAEEAFGHSDVSTALDTVNTQIDNIKTANSNAASSAEKAAEAKDIIENDTKGVEALDKATEEAAKAQENLNDVLSGGEELRKRIGDSLEMVAFEDESSKAKEALENATTALKTAKEYEEQCLAACKEIDEIITAITEVQKAQDSLDSKKNNSFEDIFNGFDAPEGLKDKAQALYDKKMILAG